MTRVMFAVLAVCVTGVAFGEDPGKKAAPPAAPAELKDPREILSKTDEALEAVKAAQYAGAYHATGWFASGVPTVKGTALLTGHYRQGFHIFKFDVAVDAPKTDVVRQLVVGGDGESFYVIDSETKTVHRGADRSIIGQIGRMAENVGLPEFLIDTRLVHAINAERVTLLPAKTLDGHECFVIEALYTSQQSRRVRWFIAKKDFLPRRVERIIRTPDGQDGAMVLDLIDLKVNPKLDKDAFKLVVPEGFTVTDLPIE